MPEPRQPVEPLAIDTIHVVLAGLTVWAVALLVTLVVPALHSGDRDWWPWTCVAGLVIGALGLIYIRRGRASAAQRG